MSNDNSYIGKIIKDFNNIGGESLKAHILYVEKNHPNIDPFTTWIYPSTGISLDPDLGNTSYSSSSEIEISRSRSRSPDKTGD